MIFRFMVRAVLVIAGIVAITAIVMALWLLGPNRAETWAVIAAGLAVVTSIVSSWPAQRVLELQQDALKPYPYPSIDVKSRYELMQLRVTNYGGSVARDIYIRWDKPLLNSKGELVRFTKQEGIPEIPILLHNESVAILIGASHTIYKQYNDMNYSGEIEFKDASGRKIKHRFFLSAETYRSTLTFEEEEPKTHYELQKIPKEIEKLRAEIKRISEQV